MELTALTILALVVVTFVISKFLDVGLRTPNEVSVRRGVKRLTRELNCKLPVQRVEEEHAEGFLIGQYYNLWIIKTTTVTDIEVYQMLYQYVLKTLPVTIQITEASVTYIPSQRISNYQQTFPR